MTCDRYQTDLALHVEGDLDETAGARIEAHLADCEHCRDFLRRLQRSQRAVRLLAEESVPEDAIERVRLRIESAVALRSSPPHARLGWGWALAASLVLTASAAALIWRQRAGGVPHAAAPAEAHWPSPAPAVATHPADNQAKKPTSDSLASVRPTRDASRPVSRGEGGTTPAQEPLLTPAEADQLARAVVAVSRVASLWDRPTPDEPESPPPPGESVRLATDDPNVVIYWQLDPKGE